MKIITMLLATLGVATSAFALTYPVVDTGQTAAYGKYAGQDAHYSSNKPSFENNGDGTVTDLVTGLMWTRDPGEKMTHAQAVRNASKRREGGHDDWRLPTIKELYSLISFSGTDPDPRSNSSEGLTPFIDDTVFDFRYGDPTKGERIIDSQFATSTIYVSTTMDGNETMFGVNFADGRIKGYPVKNRRGEKTFHVLYVRGNPEYGKNEFEDNGDGTVTDTASGLTWMKADSGAGMDWPSALAYARDMEFAGHSDWRLPDAKELQSIVDYSRSPDTTDSAAIDPIFETTAITNEGGERDYAQYWTSTSHVRSRGSSSGVYVAFGRSLGWMENRRTGQKTLMDVHGAGSQRSDPKTGDASRFPYGRGPQGDVVRIENMVRLVRGGGVTTVEAHVETESQSARGRPGARSKRRQQGSKPRPLETPADVSAAITSPVNSGATASKPNIVFIYADDMGWTGTSVEMIEGDPETRSDYYQTPNLEKLASSGMVFSQAYSPGPMCTPSRAAVLTGKTPAELHITTPGGGKTKAAQKLLTPKPSTRLPGDLPTIGTTLKAEGYSTALLGKWHIGRDDHAGLFGFDYHDGSTENGSTGSPSDPKEIFSLAERGIRFMEESVKTGKPFFLQVSHYAVHTPVEARPESIAKFEAISPGSIHKEEDYAGMTWDLDQSMGRIFEALRKLRIEDNTFVVFMSDNGAAGNRRRPNNTPLKAGKGTLYEGGIRVPLIISGPGFKTGYSTVAVSGTDLFASFATWAGAAYDAGESEDLTPLLKGLGEQFRREQALLFHYPHYGRGRLQKPQTALVVDDWKLIKDWETGSYQLYNLESDPGEESDRSSDEPDVFAKMLASMDSRLQEVDAQLPVENPDPLVQ